MAAPTRVVKDGKTVGWQARWRDANGRQRKQTFERQADAKKHLAKMGADKARGLSVDLDTKTTVAAECRAWVRRRGVGGATRRRYLSLIDNQIADTPLGARPLAGVLPSEVQDWATNLSKGLAPTTVRKAVVLLGSVYRAALLDRRVAVSPVADIALPTPDHHRIVPLTVAEVMALADAVPAQYRALVIVSAGLGLRRGEALALRVGDVDFLRREVHVRHQVDRASRALVSPKTQHSRRTLPLPQFVADALAAHLAAYPAGPDVGCTCGTKAPCAQRASGLIFHTGGGGPVAHDYWGHRIFHAAVATVNAEIAKANAELPEGARVPPLPPGVTTHDLRHHFASVLIAAGESVVAVAEWLGHRNATLVLTTYGHLLPNSEDRMRKAIDGVYASCAPNVPSVRATTS